MSITKEGIKGRVYVKPAPKDLYEIGLSGEFTVISSRGLKKMFPEIYNVMKTHCGRKHDGTSHPARKKLERQVPYWRVENPGLIEIIIRYYATLI